MINEVISKYENTGILIRPLPGNYLICSNGDVWSLRRNKPIKLNLPKSWQGYYRITMVVEGGLQRSTVHRLVALSFIGQPPTAKHQVRHLNGIKTDNRVENLKWGTCKENHHDKYRHGKMPFGDRNGTRLYPEKLKQSWITHRKSRMSNLKRGSDVHGAKLKTEDIGKILVLRKSGKKLTEIAALFQVSHSNISKICLGHTWRHLK